MDVENIMGYYSSSQKKNVQKWYEKPIYIVLLLIFFFPLGLFLMLKFSNWGKPVKIAVTVIVALFVIIGSANNENPNELHEGTNTLSEQSQSPKIYVSPTDSETPTNTVATNTVQPSPSQTPAVTESPAPTPAHNNTTENTKTDKPSPTPKAPATQISLISLTSPIKRGNTASIKIKGATNIVYKIAVKYQSDYSYAEGLGSKKADENGIVEWSWKVGARTSPGEWDITITGDDGSRYQTKFKVTE
jgi:hypothetical protein